MTFDLYVLRAILRPLVVTLVLGHLVLLAERFLHMLDVVLGSEGSVNVLLKLLAFLVPHYVGLALPLGLFLGVLLGFRRLNRDSELDAVQAAGVGLSRLSRPVLVVTVAAAALTAATVSYLQPHGRFAYRAIVFDLTNASLQAFLRKGVFRQISDTTFMMEDVSSDRRQFSKVFIYREDDGDDWSVVTARDGALSGAAANQRPLLHLFEGVRLSEGPSTSANNPDSAPFVGMMHFEELSTALTSENDQLLQPRGQDERELTLTELWQSRHDPPSGVGSTDMIAEFHGRVVRSLSILALPFLAISLALGYRRSNNFYGVAIGGLILVGYNELLSFGENLVESGSVPTVVGLWLPFAAFACVSLWTFLRIAHCVPRRQRTALLELPSWLERTYKLLLPQWRREGR
ncbi:MAG: LPS export ABC transporter permease LptF [Alphaproteobacteria bacterium]